jgi:hypothetical protein
MATASGASETPENAGEDEDDDDDDDERKRSARANGERR